MTSSRRNLIISPIGDDSVHESWLSHPTERSFDLFLIHYGQRTDFGRRHADHYAQRQGFKWELLHWAVNEHGALVNQYQNVWLPDNDVRADTLSINRLFELFEHYGLQMAQPAISAGEVSYQLLRQHQDVILRYSPFVEIMCPLFTRRALARVAPTFLESRSGWGLDWLWTRFFEPHQVAIIDAVGVEHTGTLFGGENYQRLAKLGLNPQDDFARLAARHGGFKRRLHRRLVRGTIKLPEIRQSPVKAGLLARLLSGLSFSWHNAS
jgi:hypothetical protein